MFNIGSNRYLFKPILLDSSLFKENDHGVFEIFTNNKTKRTSSRFCVADVNVGSISVLIKNSNETNVFTIV